MRFQDLSFFLQSLPLDYWDCLGPTPDWVFFLFFAEQDLTVYSVIVLGEIRAGTVSMAVRLDLAEVSFDGKILQLGLKGVFFGVPTFFLNKTDLRWMICPQELLKLFIHQRGFERSSH